MLDSTSELKSSLEDYFIETSSVDVAQKINSNNEIELEKEENKMWTRKDFEHVIFIYFQSCRLSNHI